MENFIRKEKKKICFDAMGKNNILSMGIRFSMKIFDESFMKIDWNILLLKESKFWIF